MDYKTLKAQYNAELNPYFEDYYKAFEAEYDANDAVISDTDIDNVIFQTELPAECGDVIKAVRDAVLKDSAKHEAVCFWRYVTVEHRQPWENGVYTDEFIKIGDYEYRTANLLLVALMLNRTLRVKNPPRELNIENLHAFNGYTTQCRNNRGYWGINEFNWNCLCAGGVMFMQGVLKFCPSYFTGEFPVLKKDGEYISVAGGEWFVGKDGELVATEEESVTKTTFVETDEYIKAHRIDRSGRVSLTPETFLKSEYEQFLRGGDGTIDIHIPSKIAYNVDTVRDAFVKALDYYGRFMPEHKIKAIAGYSWIFAPQLCKVMPEESNILAVNRYLHILPTIGSYDETCRFLREGSSLQQRIAAETAKGTKFHYAIMYKPVDEVK